MSLFRQPSQTVRVALVLLCVMVVMLRVSGAHMHLCFDGSEPPASLHFDSDGGLHHAQDEYANASDVKHVDADVTLAGDALIKKATVDLDLLALMAGFAFLLFVLSPKLRLLLAPDLLLPANAHRAHLRPLLRGPPL